jgi:hypothetical protein
MRGIVLRRIESAPARIAASCVPQSDITRFRRNAQMTLE